MSNNGILTNVQMRDFTDLEIGAGKIFTKIYAKSRIHSAMLTLKNTKPEILDM